MVCKFRQIKDEKCFYANFAFIMVSPRKRTLEPSRHQGAERKNIFMKQISKFRRILTEIISGVKSRAKHQVFARKRFFLDIKNLETPPVKQLAKDLILLGGVSK